MTGYWICGGLELRISWRFAWVSASELVVASELEWLLANIRTTGLDSSTDRPLGRVFSLIVKVERFLRGEDEGTMSDVAYRPMGGLEARGFLAPDLLGYGRLSIASDRLRFLDELEDDRECDAKSGCCDRGARGEDVPSLMTFGLEDESVIVN